MQCIAITLALFLAVITPIDAGEPIVASSPHVRVINGNSCGSGTICGQDFEGAYVLTNAHVAGTALGRVVQIDLVTADTRTRIPATTRYTGYSDRTMVDYAICYAPNLHVHVPMQLIRTAPTLTPFATKGSPRCIWPQQQKPFEDARSYGQGLLTGIPNAIGGQSGSAIFDADKRAIALLTWSINGRCAGQTTQKLWQVAQTQTVDTADNRPEGLRELATEYPRAPTENGIQASVAMEVADLPIWHNPADPDIPKDPCCQDQVSHYENLLDLLRKILALLESLQ